MVSIYNKFPVKTSKMIDINIKQITPAGEKIKHFKILPMKYIDVKARGTFPANILSNFAPTNFELDGVKIKSMEGFLQSLKIKDPEQQKMMCLLDGFEAKKMSKSVKRSENDMLLFWKGKRFLKGSVEYNNLKRAVIEASKSSKDGYFNYGGKNISSVGAFLTAIKVESPEIQDLILKMSQDNLKQISKNITPKYQVRNLYWKGNVIKRDSQEYQNLLDRAYDARYCADFNFRRALKVSKGHKLLHTKGKTDILDTILTQNEFLQRLNSLRDRKNYKYKVIDIFTCPYYVLSNYIKNRSKKWN